MTEITWKYVKPLKAQDAITNVETEIGISLPTDLKDIIEKYNNGRPSRKLFDTSTEKELEFKKLLSFNSDDIENIFEFLHIDTQLKGLVPLASDPGGNFICLYKDKIVYWNHENDTTEFLANTFSEFLNKLY